MNEQTITSRFRAHDCVRNTSAQNKRYIVPHILAARSPRDEGDLPNAVLQEPGKHWNGYQWKNDEGDLIFENREDYCDSQWASNLYDNDPGKLKRPGKYIWKNCFVSTATDPYNAGMKWGTREWNVPHREFIDCDFFAIPKEHGLYISVYEGTVVDRCTFIRMGSQGIQVVHRIFSDPPYSPTGDNRPYEAKPLHILKDSHFIDCADKGSRPSYNASYFNPGSPEFPGTLKVENCSFVANWDTPQGTYDSHSTGALVVAPMSNNPVLTDNFMELVEVKNCLFDFTDPNRSIVNIRSTDTIVFEDCTFIQRDTIRTAVTIDKPNGYTGDTKSKRIIIRNCIGIDAKLSVVLGDDYGDEVKHDLHTPGKEIVIDGGTGMVLSERRIGPEDPEAHAAEIVALRKEYFGTDAE